MRYRESSELGFRTQTMPGSVVLLLSLLILSTGSDARRIRKRGLNHKVRLLTSPLMLFMGVQLSSMYFRTYFRIFSRKLITVQYHLCYRELLSHHEGSFVAEVRGGQLDLSAFQ